MQGFSPVYSTKWSHFAALLYIGNVGIINKSISLSIWSSESDPHPHGCPSHKPRAEEQFIPLIHPPLLVDNNFVTDIQTKANIFNKFFAQQCTPLENSSVLPVNQKFLTQSRLNSIDINENEVLSIIRALNIHKAHGYDDISIRMIKMCDKSLLKPLTLLFENSMKSSCYPDIWKRSNIIPVHKKNDKQLVNNYRPISLLPCFGKIFEKIIFNKIYHFLLEENLLNPNQSGFRLADSCIN